MSIITIDFETYYDKDYSLSKMTTEEYINDPRFEVIGVGIKVDDGKPEWFTGEDVRIQLESLDWRNSALLCHNILFDGAILAFKYGIIPAFYFDTLSMARALHGTNAGGSLKALASRYHIGEKGDEVIQAIGKRRSDFTEVELERYGAYCRNDVDLTHRLFNCLQPFPDTELKLIDLTIRMYTKPILRVDDALLIDRLSEVKAEKSEMLQGLMVGLKCETEEAVRKELSSNKKFAAILSGLGVTPPMKVSKTTGKAALALAKTDEGFIKLQEHDDPFVQQLCAVRLGTKSTIEESRIERFIGIGKRNRGRLPVPLRYYGAHTGRWSGLDAVNFQNLPSRDKRKKALKNAIVAPDGHLIINADSSQIEARVLAWLAGQDNVVSHFANGEDVYSTFASKIYGRTITKADPIERFVGKTCILGLGYGTGATKLQQTLALGGAVLTNEECKRIVDLYRSDNYRIPELWKECDLALQQMMGGVFAGVRPLGNGEVLFSKDGILLPNKLYIRYPNLRYGDDSKVIYDSRKGPVNIWGGAMVENCLMVGTPVLTQRGWVPIEAVCSSDLVHDGVEFIRQGGVVFKSVQACVSVDGVWMTPDHEVLTDDGWQAAVRKPRPFRPEIRGLKGTSSDTEQRKALAVVVPLFVRKVCRKIWSRSKAARDTRWLSPLWAHDQGTSITGQPHPRYEQISSLRRVAQYVRQVRTSVASGMEKLRWARDHGLSSMGEFVSQFLAGHGIYVPEGIGSGPHRQRGKLHAFKLPVGEPQTKFNEQTQYSANRGYTSVIQEIRHSQINSVLQTKTGMVYDILNAGPRQRFVVLGASGPFIVHNCVQALARIIIGEQMLKIAARCQVVLTVHDSVVCVVPVAEVNESLAFITETMSTAPSWAAGLPVTCETKYSESYGEC